MIEKVEYRGWKNNLRISNGDAEVTITLADGTSQVTGYGWEGGPP